MNVIHIPPITAGQKADAASYEQWRAAAYALIGYSGTDFFTGSGKQGWDFTWLAGRLFKRERGEPFFQALSGGPGPVEVLCECGGTAFYVSYGSYECIATCVACGKADTVYSG